MTFSSTAQQLQCVTIPVINDVVDEELESFNVSVTGGGVEDQAQIFIVDDGNLTLR